ncbi:MAG: membrane protein insertase YidC [Elusimicrobia bacterium]|nr:membrane protein insertase YidC [Elusimicrobiota bacterium]
MSKNFLIAILVSFSILIGWDALVMKRLRPAPPSAAPARGQVSPSTPTAISPASSPSAEATLLHPQKTVEYTFGENRVAFNVFGASVQQWWIQEFGEQWVPLVPERGFTSQPLTTFPDLEFRVSRPAPNEVLFEGTRENGLRVKKVFRISPDGHIHQIDMTLENPGAQPVEASYSLGWGPGIASGDPDPKEQEQSQRALAFDAPRFLKLKPSSPTGTFQWWGVDARYFLAAFLNEERKPLSLKVTRTGKFYTVERDVQAALPSKTQSTESFHLYLGPKGYAQLASLELGLERSVDFGTFGGLGKIVLKVLYFFENVTHNYGWAIILLTLVIQILMIPLTLKSFQHSQRMKTLQPQIKKIQALYKSDPKRLNVEMLNLYQRHGLRFMGMEGCFPILIQLPVFWALYTTLRNAFELRHAPWLGWIQDLSKYDPFYILPILMGVGMLAQQKMTMASMDPAQARMMYIMPVIFIFFFFKLPSGLVLYWFTQSLLTILIQLVLMKKFSKEQGVS